MSTTLRSTEVVTTLRLTNSHPDTIRFSLEPWGEEVPMPPGATFEVMARGPEGGALEVDVSGGYMAVWGWAGSVLALSHDGATLGGEVRTPVPTEARQSGQQTPAAGERSRLARRP